MVLEKTERSLMSSSFFLCESKRKNVASMHSFSGNDYLSSFFSQRKESCVETHPAKRRIHRDIIKFRTLHFGDRRSK